MRRVRSFAIFLIFMAMAACIVAFALLPESGNSLTIGLVLVLGGVCSISTVVDLMRKRFDVFELIHPICYLSFLYYGASTLYMLYDRKVAWDSRVFSYLNASLALCIAGTAAMLYGYFLTRRLGGAKKGTLEEVPAGGWIAVLFVIGVLGQVGGLVQERQMVATGRVSGLVSLVQKFDFLAFFYYFFLLLQFFRRKATFLQKALLFCVVVPTELAFIYAWFGGKFFTLTVVGLPVVAFWYAREKLPSKAVLALLLLTVFFIFPFYGVFRNTNVKYSVATRVSKTVDSLSGYTPEAYTEESFFLVGQRMALINSVAVILRETGRSVDYQYGRTIGLTLTSLVIPRFLWPDKPTISIGKEFARVFRILPRTNKTTYISMTPIGEFYWNFGVPGVILGMFLFGVGYQLLYEYFGRRKAQDPLRLAMYASLMPVLMSFEGNMAGWIAMTLRALVFYAVLDVILRNRSRVRAVAPPPIVREVAVLTGK